MRCIKTHQVPYFRASSSKFMKQSDKSLKVSASFQNKSIWFHLVLIAIHRPWFKVPSTLVIDWTELFIVQIIVHIGNCQSEVDNFEKKLWHYCIFFHRLFLKLSFKNVTKNHRLKLFSAIKLYYRKNVSILKMSWSVFSGKATIIRDNRHVLLEQIRCNERPIQLNGKKCGSENYLTWK